MKQVVVINQFALPRTEGGGTRHIDLFGRLTGWTPLIIAGDRNHYTQRRFHTDDARFRLVRVPRQGGGALARLIGWMIFAIRALAICLARRDLDLVYGSTPQPFAALAGLWAARLRRRPFVLEVRDLWPESIIAAGRLRRGSLVHRLFARLERYLCRNASRIVCVTEGWEEHFAGLGVPYERIVVVPNGTEPADFEVTETRDELRKIWSIDGFTAVFAGAHGPKDGINLILDAASHLPDINFLLMGAGSAKLLNQQRADQEHLGNVSFREPVSKVDLPRILRACDVGIHTVSSMAVFRKGMSPNKLFDYMAAELPIVSNAEFALRRVIRSGECGQLGATDELAQCLSTIREASDEQRAAWGRRASEIVLERFSRSAAANLLSQNLDKVVASPRATGSAK